MDVRCAPRASGEVPQITRFRGADATLLRRMVSASSSAESGARRAVAGVDPEPVHLLRQLDRDEAWMAHDEMSGCMALKRVAVRSASDCHEEEPTDMS